jgi:AcrR family transcriptional regulator
VEHGVAGRGVKSQPSTASEAQTPDPAGSGLGLREHKKVQTHRALQAAARRLVAERDLASVTVDEIAKAVQVSTRTFFNYFDSKEGCVVDAPPGTWQRFASELEGRPATEAPLESLRVASVAMMPLLTPGLQQLAPLVRANPDLMQRHAASFEEFDRVIEDWAARRSGEDPQVSVYPMLLAAVAGSAVQAAIARWEPSSGQRGMTAILDEVFGHYARGLEPPNAVGPSRW